MSDYALTASDLSHRYLWQANAVDQLMADEALSPLPLGEGQGEGSEGQGETSGSDGYDLTTPGTVVWPLSDHLGTIRDLAVSENDVTTIANHRIYDSFGRLTSQTTAAVDCLFGYTGRAYDASTGLQDNWHRKYDVALGRWLSEDPMGFTAGDANITRYVGNSPTNATDPTGLTAKARLIPSEFALKLVDEFKSNQNAINISLGFGPANEGYSGKVFVENRQQALDVISEKLKEKSGSRGGVIEFINHSRLAGGIKLGDAPEDYINEDKAIKLARDLNEIFKKTGVKPDLIVLNACNVSPRVVEIIANETGVRVLGPAGFSMYSVFSGKSKVSEKNKADKDLQKAIEATLKDQGIEPAYREALKARLDALLESGENSKADMWWYAVP